LSGENIATVKHLAIFTPESVKLIFSGKKKIDGRFSKIKIPPFGKVSSEDLIYIKISGEKIVGQFIVDRVLYFDHPKKEELTTLVNKYSSGLRLSKTFWLEHERVNYVSLMFIKSVTKFIIAPEISKKDLRPWVVLD
jgi:hypothetical protein